MTEYLLKVPIARTFRGPDGDRSETVDRVTVRPPKGRDMRVMDKVTGEIAQSLAMIAQLTGLEPYQVDELDVRDISALGEIIEGFTKPGRATGTMS